MPAPREEQPGNGDPTNDPPAGDPQPTPGERPGEEQQPPKKPLTLPELQTALEEATAELEKARAALKAANREAAERRVKLDAYEEEERKRNEAAMSELEKAQAAAAEFERKFLELQTEHTTMRVRHVIEAAAVELGFAAPADAYELLSADGVLASVEIAEDGKVTGFQEALEKLSKSGRLPMRESNPGIGTPRLGRGKPARIQPQPQTGDQPPEEYDRPLVKF